MTSLKPVVTIKPLRDADRAWANELAVEYWGSTLVISRGKRHDISTQPGFVAWRGTQRAGLLTYHIEGRDCEVTALASATENIGAGSALLAAVEDAARAAGCSRVWLITTNDNLHALGFYQRRGYRLVAVYPGALDETRKIKPQIPLTGLNNIPLRDEIELEKML